MSHSLGPDPVGGGSATGGGVRALVVDDSATVRAYHRMILERAGFTVHDAANGYEGLEQVVAGRFDLLVVDMNMPLMDGLGLVEAVRAGQHCPEVPIIMISTEAAVPDSDEARRCGVDLYLVKPADPEKLAAGARLLTRPVAAGGLS